VPPEGTAYGRVIFDYHIVPFLTLRNMGEDPFSRIRFWKEYVYYTGYSMTPALTAAPESPENCSDPGRTVPPSPPTPPTWQQFPFADDERLSQCGYSGLKQADYSNGLLTYANLWPNLDSGKLARLIARTVGQRASPWLRAYFNDTEPAANFLFNSLPLDYFAQASRNLYVRSAWAGNASSLNFMIGRSPSAGHKHFDGGSFQWWRNGRWMSRESTGYVGSGESVRGLENIGTVDVDHPVAHNTVLFEGRATSNGENGLPEGNADMLRLFSNADFVYGAADLVPTFRYRRASNLCRYDWPYAEHAVREFVYVRAIETLVMIDRLTGSGDSGTYLDGLVNCYHPFTGVRRTPAQVRRHVNVHSMGAFSQASGWYLSNSGAQRFAVQPLLPAAATVSVVNERTGMGGASQGNFRLDMGASGSATIEFVTVLHASSATATLPTVALQTVGADRVVSITSAGVQHEVRFQLGALPQTTSITIAGNTVTPPATVSPLQPPEFNVMMFDIDGNGAVDAATDCILIMRYLLGLRGSALIASAIGGGATRSSADDVTQHLQSLQSQLDIDGNGQPRAATDALLIARYMRNLRGAALIQGAVNGSARSLTQIQEALSTATGQ